MKLRRVIIMVLLLFVMAIGVGTSLYISKGSSGNNVKVDDLSIKKDDMNAAAKDTMSTNQAREDMMKFIGPKTIIVKRDVYTKGELFELSYKMEVTGDTIGMDKDKFQNFISSEGYKIDEFTGDKVVISKSINTWPIGLFVLKSVDNNIVLYKVDDKGELVVVAPTEITLDLVSENDKDDLIKGKVFKTKEEAEVTIAEYDS
ncbi:MAG: hypothetical protein RR898_10915 [Clostridium sp.]|uniref:hypothetical protein n=1 Tax=Clostridium sp. TaxID=1506 RepID=UPI002FC805C1